MTIDLSKLKVGDTVRFRCGGDAVVLDVENKCGVSDIIFSGCTGRLGYYYDGSFYKDETHAIDITEIIEKPFDWADVENGQAFRYKDCVWHYIGKNPSPTTRHTHVFKDLETGTIVQATQKMRTKMTRYPEGDLQCAK